MTRYLVLKDTDNETIISILEHKEEFSNDLLKSKIKQSVQDEFMEDVELIRLTELNNSYKVTATLISDNGEKYTRDFVLTYTALY